MHGNEQCQDHCIQCLWLRFLFPVIPQPPKSPTWRWIPGRCCLSPLLAVTLENQPGSLIHEPMRKHQKQLKSHGGHLISLDLSVGHQTEGTQAPGQLVATPHIYEGDGVDEVEGRVGALHTTATGAVFLGGCCKHWAIPQICSLKPTTKGQSAKAPSAPRKGLTRIPLPTPVLASNSVLLTSRRIWDKACCLSSALCGTLFWLPQLSNASCSLLLKHFLSPTTMLQTSTRRSVGRGGRCAPNQQETSVPSR